MIELVRRDIRGEGVRVIVKKRKWNKVKPFVCGVAVLHVNGLHMEKIL